MFKVRRIGYGTIYTVYAFERVPLRSIPLSDNFTHTKFLIYRDGWVWVDAEDYEPVIEE